MSLLHGVYWEVSCIQTCERKTMHCINLKTHWKYVSKTKKVKMTIQQMKEMYEKGKEVSEPLGNSPEEKKDLQKDKDQFLEESFQHVVRLDEIALKGVSSPLRSTWTS
ncbi:hypothetical protein F7725_021273 [Dissostichus mawsoni]|uniref:Uncharacterized protein n=1 Tax=Dissostichus mawsoni TaxID=36200 RepID=A0A7J5YFP2_DISMA|nr:hypothetical protein F7725_021273 [Dissostichus mawsoni]